VAQRKINDNARIPCMAALARLYCNAGSKAIADNFSMPRAAYC
jgi:hypothetical protein